MMPQFIIERQFLLQMYQHILVEADDLSAACASAVENDDWTGLREDYECARTTRGQYRRVARRRPSGPGYASDGSG